MYFAKKGGEGGGGHKLRSHGASKLAARVSLRFCAGQALPQHCDLPGVMRFVFADVEPLAVIVGWPPAPGFVDRSQPFVIAFSEFGEGLLANFRQCIQVEAMV